MIANVADDMSRNVLIFGNSNTTDDMMDYTELFSKVLAHLIILDRVDMSNIKQGQIGASQTKN